MARGASLFAALFLFWLVLSGHYKPFLVAAGAGVAAAVVLFARRLALTDPESHPIHLWRMMFLYWPWLAKEIVKSAWDVSWRIVHPRLPISPTLVRVKPSQRTSLGLVTHANSITLTPGTITVEAGDGEFLVHGLTAAGAQATVDSEMDRRIAALERAP